MPSLHDKYLTFNGIDSRSYGVYISGSGTFNGPGRTYQNIVVPGRDGDLLSSSTRLQNETVTYPAGVVKNAESNLAGFRSALLASVGYQELKDSYHPNEYRMAVFKGPFDVDMISDLSAGQFDITFECKPQRYLNSGKTVVTCTSSTTAISNPTSFAARPLFRVYGYGTLTVNTETVTITDYNNTYIDIDSELMDCFHDATNLNGYVTFSDNDFPTLASGANAIGISGNITSVEITPRWWQV